LDLKLFAAIFASVFLAELGDKTQLATLLFASDARNSKLTVLAASASALVLSALAAVLAGSAAGSLVDPRRLRLVAGAGFIAIGAWTLAGAFRP
jgi:putative Ca2+/H+ antiporter (TMEM165/GDT1 family)